MSKLLLFENPIDKEKNNSKRSSTKYRHRYRYGDTTQHSDTAKLKYKKTRTRHVVDMIIKIII